ncbi:hypothetical protein SFRURICE_019678 [Spodoptera frugiperda]|nr:hypothetical protein SFRURICE_019678 [Spodoptera frugiperda]
MLCVSLAPICSIQKVTRSLSSCLQPEMAARWCLAGRSRAAYMDGRCSASHGGTTPRRSIASDSQYAVTQRFASRRAYTSRSGSVSLGPVRAPSRRVSGSESDTSSASGACSLRSVSSQRPKRGTFKRPRLEEGRGPSSNEQEAPASKIPTASRGRGKRKGSERLVPTTQAEPTEADSSEMEVSGGEGSVGQNVDVTGEVSLRKAVMEALRMVAGQKSQNARNGVLRHAKVTIMKAARQNGAPLAAGRQMTALQKELGEMRREMARLTASNAAMEAELRSAKAELAAARGGRGQPSQSTEADMIGLVRREMAAFQQRFDVLEGRILRPPLAASQTAPKSFAAAVATNSGQSSRSAQGQPPARELVASPAQAPAAPAAKAPKGRRRRGTVSQPAVAPTGVEPTPVSDFLVDGGEWQVVGEAKKAAKEGRKRRKKEQRQRRQQRRKEKRAAAMLVAPKTAAVVITLQPDAVKRGVTYGDVLAKLKAAVNPAEYGAPDGFSMKYLHDDAVFLRLAEYVGDARAVDGLELPPAALDGLPPPRHALRAPRLLVLHLGNLFDGCMVRDMVPLRLQLLQALVVLLALQLQLLELRLHAGAAARARRRHRTRYTG